MKKLTGIIQRLQDWKEGIPSDRRAEARLLRDEISDIQSRLDAIHQQIQPAPQAVVRDDLFGYDIIHQAQIPPEISSDVHASLHAEAARLITLRDEKMTQLDTLRTKKKKRISNTEPISAGERVNRYVIGVELMQNALDPVYAAILTLELDDQNGKKPLRQALASVRNALTATSERRGVVTQGADLITNDAEAIAHILAQMKEWMRSPAPHGGGMDGPVADSLIRKLADVFKSAFPK